MLFIFTHTIGNKTAPKSRVFLLINFPRISTQHWLTAMVRTDMELDVHLCPVVFLLRHWPPVGDVASVASQKRVFIGTVSCYRRQVDNLNHVAVLDQNNDFPWWITSFLGEQQLGNIESYQNKYCRLSRLISDCMIIPVWETVRESGDQGALSTLPPVSYHQTSPNFGKSHEHDTWYWSPAHVSLTSPLPLMPTLSILHPINSINSQLFSPFPPRDILTLP